MAKKAASKTSPSSKPAADEAAEKPEEEKTLQLPTGKLALTKDPRVYERSITKVFPPYKRVAGLDLASSCGVSFCDIFPGQPVKNATIVSGQWDLSVGSHDTNSLRYVRLKQFLTILAPDLIYYEEVKYVGQSAPPGMQKTNLTALVARAVSGAAVVQGLSAILITWAEEHNIPCEAIPIGTLKRYATGKGNAGKEDMIEAANKTFGTEFDPKEYERTGVDNICDSMFLCSMGVQNYSEGL